MTMMAPLVALAALLTAQPGGPRTESAPVATGVALFHEGEFERCIEVLSASIDAAPDVASRGQAHLFVGLSHAVLAHWPEARSAFAAALRADPTVGPDPSRIPPNIVGVFEEVRSHVRGVLFVGGLEPAEVALDGVPLGSTPWRGEVPVGRHAVRVVSPDGLREGMAQVVVAAASTTEVKPTLSTRPGRLTLRSHPTGAEVFLGDRPLGRTPLQDLVVPSGDAALRVRLRGYTDAVVPIRVGPSSPVDLDVSLELAEMTGLEPPPLFGLDRRPGTEAWTLDVGLGLGGGAPVSSNLQPNAAPTTAVRGGAVIGLEIGVGVYDLVELVGVVAPETAGARLEHFERLAPTAGPTAFELDEGVSGALRVLQLRVGLLARVTVARFGAWRPYVGVGWSYVAPTGSIQHLGLPTEQDSADEYLLTTRLSATTWSPALGLKVTLAERTRQNDYMALDLWAEARLDITDWSADLDVTALSAAGQARGEAAADEIRATFAEPGGGRTVGPQFVIGLSARF